MARIPRPPVREWFSKPTLGIDCSRWQTPNIPWKKLREAGFRFAIIKFFHGPWGGDAETRACAERQYKGAKDEGFLVGPYGWWEKSGSPSILDERINAWTKEMPLDDDLPLMIDCEEKSLPQNVQTRLDGEYLFRKYRERTGRDAICYSGSWWADLWMPGSSELLREIPYAHAAYPSIHASGTDYEGALKEWLAMEQPELPILWRGKRPLMWQADGDRGLVLPLEDNAPKGTPHVDVDVDLADWDDLCALVPALRNLAVQEPFDWRKPAPALRPFSPSEVATAEEVIAGLKF